MLVEPAKATGSVISPLSVRSFVSNELISETTPTIFLKLGMKLGDNKGKKIAQPVFYKNIHFGRFWPNVSKIAILIQNHSFLEFAKKLLHQIF